MVQRDQGEQSGEGLERVAEGRWRLKLTGRLDAARVERLWPGVIGRLGRAEWRALQVEAAGVDYCDGAGVGLLLELRRLATEREAAWSLEGLEPGLSRLVELATPEDFGPLHPAGPPREALPVEVGKATAHLGAELYALIAFVGEACLALAWAVRHPGQVRVRDLLHVAEKTGVNALPVVMLLGWLMGLIIAFQTATPMQTFGAEALIPNIVAVAMLRELGPLITAIILAGRSGSAFAAELGTMKVTEEISALTTFGLDPTRFLVLPRVLAAMLMTPMLSLFATAMGLVGGFVVMRGLGSSLATYVNRVVEQVTYVDLLGGVAKTVVFAMIVAGVGCLQGLRTGTGPGAVGDATTRAVVAGIVLIVVADGLLGVLYYAVGI